MEWISNIIEKHKKALNRVMKVRLDKETSSLRLGWGPWSKTVIIFLWIILAFAVLMTITAIATVKKAGTPVLIEFLAVIILICLTLIREFSYEKLVNIASGTFEFKGLLRKNCVYTLADYQGTETRRTIKGFPEEFRVKFNTDKGTKSYKMADLNMGYACNIEPNYEAVSELWEVIIQQMQNNFQQQQQ